MKTKTFQKKDLIIFILITLILIPLVYSDIKSDIYPVTIPSSGSQTTPTTTPSPTTPATTTSSTTASESYLEWIKKNANEGVKITDTQDKDGKVTGAVAIFQNTGGELKYKDALGEVRTISGVLPKTDSRKAEVIFNTDGSIKDIKLTTDPKSTKPLYLYVSNTKFEVPPGASADYSQQNNKAVVPLRGGKLTEMPLQIDPVKKDGLKVNYEAEETTQLPNGIVFEKAEKSFSKSTITSIDGKDYISIGNTARLNGINGYNAKYNDNVNGDTEILGLRGKVSMTDMTSGTVAKDNYISIDVKNKVFEVGAGKRKTGLIINPNNENNFITGVKENSHLTLQPRDGGIIQITKQSDNPQSLIDTHGDFMLSSGIKNYMSKDGKFFDDKVPGIPGIGFDRDVKDIASVPLIMKNYDSNGKEITKGYMTVMNNNNGWAMVPVGTTEAKLSNGDVWRSSSSSRVTPVVVGETPADGSDTWVTPPITNPPVNPAAQPNQPPQKVSDMIMSSSVRINALDATGRSVGSGTIIGDDGKGNAIIATCAHTFRDSGYRSVDNRGQPIISIDTFNPQQSGSSQGVLSRAGAIGTLIDYDAQSDVAIVSVPKNQLGNYQNARMAPAGFRVSPGQATFTAGCSHGADCTLKDDKISSINRYLGAGNIETPTESAQGRSGGGLFTSQGVLVGVLSASDKTESIFQNIGLVRERLQRKGITVH